MDHPLNQLEDCIFDYLASHANKLVPIEDIYFDITRTEGHRCSQLVSRHDAKEYFISKCYTLDRNYKNIRKLFKGTHLYLVFDQDKRYENTKYDESIFRDVPISNNNYSNWNVDPGNVVDYMFDYTSFGDYNRSYFANLFDQRDTILHILVKNNNTEKLQEILKYNDVDIDCENWKGQTPMDVATETQNTVIVSMLMQYKYDYTIKKLEKDVKYLEKELVKEKVLENEYQKTIDATGKHFNMMNKLESSRPPSQRTLYVDKPMNDYTRWTMYMGQMIQLYCFMYVMYYLYRLFY